MFLNTVPCNYARIHYLNQSSLNHILLLPHQSPHCLSFFYIQGISAVEAFHELLRQPSLSVIHPELGTLVRPVELCPILRALYKILIQK